MHRERPVTVFACMATLLLTIVSAIPSAASKPYADVVLPMGTFDFALTDLIEKIPDQPPLQMPAIPPRGSPHAAFERFAEQMADYKTQREALGLEASLAQMVQWGSPAITTIFNTQNTYQWYRGEIIPGDTQGAYRGELGPLVLVLKDQQEIPVSQIIATSITVDKLKMSLIASTKLRNTPLVILHPLNRNEVPFEDFRSDSSQRESQEVWYVFLAFIRVFNPDDVVGIRCGTEFASFPGGQQTLQSRAHAEGESR